ncbi:MAG: hypothetical protein ABGX16_00470 [Pirellulales bacterium]
MLTIRTVAVVHRQSLILGISLVVALSLVMPAWAVVPSESLMPMSTRGYLSVGDISTLGESWQHTQLGQLVQDESMKPFVQDLKSQIQRKITSVREKLGLELADLKNVAGGEIGLGLVERTNDRAALLLTVDVTGRMEQTKELLRQVDRELKKRGATQSQDVFSDTTFVTYEIPPQRKSGIKQDAIFFVKDDMLCASDNRLELEGVCRRLNDIPSSCLGDEKPYREAMRRCAREAEQLQPELRWFVNPFGYARACRSLRPLGENRYGKDYLKILTSQGFDAIQGLGGFVNVSPTGAYELLHRTAVYAPSEKVEQQVDDGSNDSPDKVDRAQDKYRLAMRMLDFPNGSNLIPQTWLPRKLATYRTFNLNLAGAFNSFGSLFDAIAGYEDSFKGVLEGLELDPYGPQVDVEKELIAHLSNRITVVTDYVVPITTKSERFLFIVELDDEAAIHATIEKFMKSDPNAYRHDFEGREVWEIVENDDEVMELDISITSLDPLPPGEEEASLEEDEDAVPTSAVCVTDGHLLIASHLDFLKSVLSQKKIDGTLANSSDYREVDITLSQLMSGDVSFRFFLRTDEAYRPTYELLRQGKMPESETLLGRVLNRMLTPPEDEDEGILRKQKIDARELPSFEMVRRYFGPAGLIVRSETDGWFIAGATLNKQLPQARVDVKIPADHQSAIR